MEKVFLKSLMALILFIEWPGSASLLLSIVLITLLRIVWMQGQMRTIVKLHLLSSVTKTDTNSNVGPTMERLYGYDSPHFAATHFTYLKHYVKEKL